MFSGRSAMTAPGETIGGMAIIISLMPISASRTFADPFHERSSEEIETASM